MDIEKLKYPIGKFEFDPSTADRLLPMWRAELKAFPEKLRQLLSTMDEGEIDTQYRPEGWTARQVVHHVCDSHSHALIRFKWALTEENPTIKPYIEHKYAALADYKLPVQYALDTLFNVHFRLVCLMDNLSEEDWDLGYHHPELKKFFTLREAAGLYDWHCRHHYAHIQFCKSIS